MPQQQCAGCFGTGRGSGVDGACVFCNGTGTVWAPDPVNPGSSSGGGGSRGGGSTGSSFWDNLFEDNFAAILAFATWIGVCYYGIFKTELAWYWPVGGGLVLAIVINWLFSGPLRFISTIVKYLFYTALIGGIIYFIYYLFTEVSSQ